MTDMAVTLSSTLSLFPNNTQAMKCLTILFEFCTVLLILLSSPRIIHETGIIRTVKLCPQRFIGES